MKFKEFYKLYTESLSDWPNEWVHYSDIPYLSINPQQTHSDPAALYFFPINFKPVSAYTSKPYKFTAKLKENAKVLDLSTVSREEAVRLMDLAGVEKIAEIEDLYPLLKREFYNDGSGRKRVGAFNKFFRDAGYDAIFDDIDVIYGRTEKQLVILNQNALEDVQFFYNKYPIYNSMKKSISELVEKISEFSDSYSISDIKSKTDGWRRIDDKLVPNKILSSEISFKKGKNYFHIKAYSDSESKRNNEISFSLMYSSPSLGYGSGASYNYAKNEWERNSIHRIVDDAKKVLTGEDYRI
jgi:hypothetical protein